MPLTWQGAGRPASVAGYVRSPLTWAVAMGVVFVASAPLPAWNFFGSPEQYIALHTVLEFAAMAVGAMVFALSWNLRRVEDNSTIVVLGAFSLGILLIDLAHTLSYSGMPDLVTASSADKAITFWLPGRILAAAALLVVAVIPARHWPRRAWVIGTLAAAAVAALVWWVGLYHRDWLPTFFVPGQGLTTTKVTTEYVIAGLYGLAALLLVRRARRAASAEFAWLACAAWVLMLGELYFTLYASVTDMFNLLGHVFKVIAYMMVYRAIFVAGVRAPYVRLEQESSLLRSLINSVPDLVSYTDAHGRYAGANAAFAAHMGLADDEIVGRTPEEVGGRPVLRGDDAARAARFEEVAVDRAGHQEVLDTIRTPYFDSAGRPLGVIEVSRDVTAYRDSERLVEQLALYDTLTGLPNRQSLRHGLDEAFAASPDRVPALAIVLVQLNDFATVNDTVGHEGGDAILRESARRIREVSAPDDLVARVGGDEFAVLLQGRTAEEAAQWAEAVLGAIAAPFAVGEEEFLTTCAIGVAASPDHGADYESLYRAADTAMYRASVEGGSACRIYSIDMRHQSALRLQLLAGLRTAVADGQLRLHYQPQVSLSDGRVQAVEALVRWEHPALGMLPPHAFIGLAEESGVILPLGEWVLRRAVHDARRWDEAGLPPIRVAVNISAVQFRQPDLVETIAGILTEEGFPAARLEVELTESVAMRNPEQAERTISGLNELGVPVAIDDFGTGYSSMAYLKRFKVTRLKIDRSFVSDLGEDPDDEAIVAAIVSMAGALRCSTIAEGVETQAQADILRSMGCTDMQGYLVSRPVPDEELRPLLGRDCLLEMP